jgi:hypothetical protein
MLLVVSSAVVLAEVTVYRGSISAYGDDDFYDVNLTEGETFIAIMRNNDCDDYFDPYLVLYYGNDEVDYDDDSAGGCLSAYDSRIEYVVEETGTYTLRVTTYQYINGYNSDPESLDSAEGDYLLCIGGECPRGSSGSPWFEPGDDRINIDAHAPVSVYCTDDNGVEIYSINNEGEGNSVLVVSGADIAAAAPGAQIATGGGATLYKLIDGTLQVLATQTDGKGYMFVWDACPATWANSYIVPNGTPILTNARVW